MALEIQKRLPEVRINKKWRDADIHYFINYGYYDGRKSPGLTVANFTHFDPNHLADRFERAAREVDHCVAISEQTADKLRELGVGEERISVIIIGADISFRPKMTLGLVGRVYPGGRKGERLISALLEDAELMDGIQIVAAHDGWGVPVRHFESLADFYRSIDYLLVPSLIDGGPVPFMEALACGTMAIAPPVGVVPQFPHSEYETGNLDSLKRTVIELKGRFLAEKSKIADTIKPYNWQTWAEEHEKLFRRLLEGHDR